MEWNVLLFAAPVQLARTYLKYIVHIPLVVLHLQTQN